MGQKRDKDVHGWTVYDGTIVRTEIWIEECKDAAYEIIFIDCLQQLQFI